MRPSGPAGTVRRPDGLVGKGVVPRKLLRLWLIAPFGRLSETVQKISDQIAQTITPSTSHALMASARTIHPRPECSSLLRLKTAST